MCVFWKRGRFADLADTPWTSQRSPGRAVLMMMVFVIPIILIVAMVMMFMFVLALVFPVVMAIIITHNHDFPLHHGRGLHSP